MEKILNKDTIKENFLAKMNSEEITAEGQVQAIMELAEEISASANEKLMAEYEELKNVTDNNILASRGIHVLTADETRYYNEVMKTGKIPADELLPETVIERVFEDLQKERPLLKLVNFIPGVGRQKIITSKRLGKAVWGPLHRDLEGQLDATFDSTETTLKSVTAYFLISNDTLDLGPRWIDRYIRLCLKEAYAESWEEEMVIGDGSLGPIGITKDLSKGTVSNGLTTYQDKASAGTLTLAKDKVVQEINNMMKSLASYEVKYKDATGEEKTQTKTRKVLGRVKLIVNPMDLWDIRTATTVTDVNGNYHYTLPNLTMDDFIESEFVPVGKVIALYDKGYHAQASFTDRIYVYPQTFAMKRATLYAYDSFGDGTPIDNNAAQVYDLAIATNPEPVTVP